ncbi:MAG: non-ribosomal peptide synthetase, partial [Intestinibacter sp.]
SITRILEVDYDLILSDEQFLDTNNIRLENVAILTVPQPFFGNQLHTIDYEVVQKSNTAYIICTSGSTGIPKKVFLSQQNISWLLEEFYSLVDFGKDSIFLFTTPYTFDVSLTELFSPIFTGGKLCCFSEDLQNVEKMKSTLEYVQKYNITHMSLSPTYADLLVDISPLNMFKGLKYLCLGGEVFGIQLANKLSDIIDQGTCVLNLYGPSETTVYATYYKVTGKEKLEVPIGKPLSGCELKIINKEDNDKKSGELYIGGNGVALGYLLDKELSEKKFIQFNSKPYYKTGDFVHFNDKDELIFENRKDNQVQVNGIRVELGEIENQVIKFKEIKHCKVVYEGRRIYIFYQVFSRENKLKEKIKKSIPKYLNPILIEVPEFLVNQNRKFDSKRMIEKYFIKASLGENGMIRAEVEEILKKLEIISYEDMDSLDTVRFFIEIEERFQLEIAEELISSLLNIEQVVEFLENKERNITKNKPLEEKTDNKICTFNEINIELMLKNYLREEDLEDNLIPTLFMQKQYALKKYNAVLSLDFKYNDFSFEGIKNIQNTIERVARKIDILRMILIEERGNLYFKKIKADKFVPVIALMNSSLQESDAKNILYNSSNSQQFFATVCPNKELLTLYFSHNIIDKSSLFKLSKIFKAFLNKQDVQISNKTYEDFIGFTKKRNKSVEIDDILPMLPDTDSFLPLLREHIDNRVLLFESRRHSREAIEVTSEAVYKLAQYIFNIDKDMQVLTGSFIADARIFNNFDATEIIGDIHSNIPFEIH